MFADIEICGLEHCADPLFAMLRIGLWSHESRMIFDKRLSLPASDSQDASELAFGNEEPLVVDAGIGDLKLELTLPVLYQT